ncbi:unnamed protein product [Symbiodinium sp. CCMP2456]|nr:unnamed protein product [Symbiodinium sp. CCMP2456]
MTSAISNALSGAQVQTKRVAASAHNVAAATVTVPSDAAEQEAGPLRVDPVSAVGGGARGQTRFLAPGYLPTYDPGDPQADAKGLVARPNVSLEQETVRQIEAQRAYEANLKVLQTGDAMLGSLLDHSS